MMLDEISTSSTGSKTWRDLLFIIIVGACLGILGGLLNQVAGSLVGAAVLLGIFGAYNGVLTDNRALMSGLVAGGIVGILVGQVGFLLGGMSTGLAQATLFGFVRGLLIGAIFGFITRARPDEDDSPGIALFLTGGSIVVGAVLGGGVGAITGFVLGVIRLGWLGGVVALILGIVVGGYLGSYFQNRKTVTYGALMFGLLGFLCVLMNGPVTGLIIGMLAGALTPMLVVSLIGFVGGLTSRGLKAGLLEATEAPAEMIQQGAVPFLAPAMLVGIIVGPSAYGDGAVVALAVTLALIGMFLGVISEVERGQTNRMTIRRLIEMVMLGADRWPIERVVEQVSGKQWRTAVFGGLTGVILGLIGAVIGLLIGQQAAAFLQTLM